MFDCLSTIAALPTLSRSDFSTQEVEDYFNYMGMLAAEVSLLTVLSLTNSYFYKWLLYLYLLALYLCLFQLKRIKRLRVVSGLHSFLSTSLLQGNYDRLEAMLASEWPKSSILCDAISVHICDDDFTSIIAHCRRIGARRFTAPHGM